MPVLAAGAARVSTVADALLDDDSEEEDDEELAVASACADGAFLVKAVGADSSADALAVGRARQELHEDWASQFKERKRKEKK